MPKTLGEWLFLASIDLFLLTAVISMIVSTYGFVAAVVLGYNEGYGLVLIIIAVVFGLLLFGNLLSVLWLTYPERILTLLWPNLLIAAIRGVYLLFAGLLFWGLFWGGVFEKYYWTYLTVAALLTVTSLPWMLFHLSLCSPKCRRYGLEVTTRIKERDSQNLSPDNKR